MDSNYRYKSITLGANAPVALPLASAYMLMSASLDLSAVQINMGDANGDFTYWALGVTIKPKNTTQEKIRIQSTIAQTVEIIYVEGEVDIEDNRSFPVDAVGTVAIYTNVFTANGGAGFVAMPRGATVLSCQYVWTCDIPGNSLRMNLGNGGSAAIMGLFDDVGAAGPGPTVPKTLLYQTPTRLPAGTLTLTNVMSAAGAFRVSVSIAYRLH